MQLSKNFTLDEMTLSREAAKRGLDNTPTKDVLARLIYTAECMERVRNILGYSIFISSGYRSPAVNAAVGGVASSQHLLGEAVDFTCPKFGTPRDIVNKLKSYSFVWDEMILEYDRWVHLSFTKGTNRKKVLVIGTTSL